MAHHVFFDESGDQGWSLNAPYRKGGSSRYLTVAFVGSPQPLCKHTYRLVRDFRIRHGIPFSQELKGTYLTADQLADFALAAVALLEKHPEIRLHAITVQKARVQDHIRGDSNKLYNWMVALCMLDELASYEEVILQPDIRSIKVASGKSLVDYLQTELWFKRNVRTRLTFEPMDSHRCRGIQFADLIAHAVWSHFENGSSEAYKVLGPVAHTHNLFFEP